MDIMHIDHRSVLYIIDSANRFSTYRFLTDVDTSSVRAAFVEFWASIKIVLSKRTRVGRGSCFGSNFYSIVQKASIDIARSRIEAHSSLRIKKRYHHPLQNIFRKAKI